jgi:hypothetical protein
MKRQMKKLQLSAETVRSLPSGRLAHVAGGASNYACGPDTFDIQTDRYFTLPRPPTIVHVP